MGADKAAQDEPRFGRRVKPWQEMRIYFGYKPAFKELGRCGPIPCPTCQTGRRMVFGISYDLVGPVMFIPPLPPILSTGKRYVMYCPVCNNGSEMFEVSEAVFHANVLGGAYDGWTVTLPEGLRAARLPWQHRFGWPIWVGLVSVWVVVAILFGSS